MYIYHLLKGTDQEDEDAGSSNPNPPSNAGPYDGMMPVSERKSLTSTGKSFWHEIIYMNVILYLISVLDLRDAIQLFFLFLPYLFALFSNRGAFSLHS